MAASVIRKTMRDTTLTLTDGTPSTPLTLVLAFMKGDLTINIPGETIVRNDPRGVIDSVPALRKGNDQPMTFSFSGCVADFSDGTEKILADLLLKNDVGAGWISTLDGTGNAEVMALHFDIGVEGTDHGDGADHSFRLPHCTFEGTLDESGEFWEISMSGTSHAVRPSTLV
jgi:hypothetical protein